MTATLRTAPPPPSKVRKVLVPRGLGEDFGLGLERGELRRVLDPIEFEGTFVNCGTMGSATRRQGLMTSGNLKTVPAMGRTTLTCRAAARRSRSK